jgi:hypothetical protein
VRVSDPEEEGGPRRNWPRERRLRTEELDQHFRKGFVIRVFQNSNLCC